MKNKNFIFGLLVCLVLLCVAVFTTAEPSCTIGDNQTVNEDSGANTLDSNMSVANYILCTESNDLALTYTILSQSSTYGDFTNPNNDDFVYTVTGANQSGEDTVYFNVSNELGNESITFDANVTIVAVNDNPWWDDITNGSVSITEDTASQNVTIGYQQYFRDVEDDQNPTLTIISDNETDITCAMDTGDIECSPTNNFTGPFILTVNGTDSGYLSEITSFEITVDAVNDDPWWNGTANTTYSYNEDFGINYTIWDEDGLNNTYFDVEDSDLPYNCTVSTNDTSMVTNVWYNGSIVADSVANANGVAIITVNCSDTGWLSAVTNFEITISNVNDAPSVPALNEPLNNTNFSTVPQFNWSNSTDIDGDSISYIFEILNLSFSTVYYNESVVEIANTTQEDNISSVGLSDGDYYWRVLANDTDNSSWSEVRYFTMDSVAPVVSLNSPSDNSYDADGLDIIFNFTVAEENPDKCTLWFRSNVTNWDANETISYSNNVQHNFSSLNLTDAVYVWNVECNDTANSPAFASANRTVTVDTTVPTTPTVTEPSDTSINPRDSISYTCASSDATAGISSWAWTLTKPPNGGTVTKTGSAVTSDSQTFSGDDTNLAGTYNVKCEAEDKAGHKSSSSKTFTVYYSHHAAAASAGPSAAAKIDLSTEEEITIKEKQGTISTFTLDGETIHTITIKEVTLTTVTIVIESDPIEITLLIGETKEVDVDGDGENDISVTLNSITEGVADITTKRLAPLPEVKPAEEVTPEEKPPTETPVEEAPSKAWLWILIIVILAVIAVGYWFMKKKYPNIFLKEPFPKG